MCGTRKIDNRGRRGERKLTEEARRIVSLKSVFVSVSKAGKNGNWNGVERKDMSDC